MSVSIFCSSSLQPCQNDVQSPGEGHLELMNLGEVFLGAFFPLFPIEIAARFAVAPSSQNYEFGGSISFVLFHHISQVSVCDLLHLCSVLLSDLVVCKLL